MVSGAGAVDLPTFFLIVAISQGVLAFIRSSAAAGNLGGHIRVDKQALSALTRGKTVITIAHRLATIEQADQILVIDDGQVVQQGTHETLAAVPGKYKEFIDICRKSEGWSLAD